jgi:hypothetical protein
MKNTRILHGIETDLHSVVKSIQQLAEDVARIAAAVEKLDDETSPKATRASRAPVRKKVVIKDGVVEKVKRIPASKIVLDLIKRSAQGMDTAALMKATGFNQRKIHNITFRLKKERKIESVARGVYKGR